MSKVFNMFDLPFETTFVIYIAFISLILGILTLVSLLVNRVRRIIKRIRFQQIKYISIPQNVFRFLITILWIALSAAALFLAAFVQSFQNFTKKELIAEVRCRPLEDELHSMLLELTPILSHEKKDTQGFILNGDQWALEGDILKWDDWLNFAGLHTMFKLTRVKGRYINIQDERDSEQSVYSLVKNEEDPRWRWLYKYGYRLRFVDAVYGNTVYTYPSKENVYEIYVTTSGFSVKVKEQ